MVNIELLVDNLMTPVLYGDNDILEEYTKRLIILEKWYDMMKEIYGCSEGCVYCDFEKIYKRSKNDIYSYFRSNLEHLLREELRGIENEQCRNANEC